MRVIEIREKTVSIASAITNAYIDFSKMTCSVVALITDVVSRREAGGWLWFQLQWALWPGSVDARALLPAPDGRRSQDIGGRDWREPGSFPHLGRVDDQREARGHGDRSVAVGTIDMAVWDAVAKIAGKPLYRLLADRYRNGKVDDKVWVYAAGGYYYPGKDMTALRNEMKRYRDIGYQVVKMKVGAVPLDEDIRRIEAVLAVVGEGKFLAVDANGRFDLNTAIAYGEALKPYGLFWYEEAGDPLDYALQAELSGHYGLPIATGENLFSHQDARNLVRYGGLHPDRDWLQFDCALSYGLVEYLRTLEMLQQYGWSTRRVVPHGGHQMSLNIAAGLHLGGNESYPGVFQPFGGFADGIAIQNGFVGLPNVPGVGFETKAELFKLMKSLSD